MNGQAKEPGFFNIDIKIPSRLVRLVNNDTSQVYLDQKSKSILTIVRSKIGNPGETSVTSESLYNNLLSDDNCFQVNKEWMQLKLSECHIVSWKTKTRKKNRQNNQNNKAFIEVGGLWYTLHLSSPSINEKDMIPLFYKMLKSIDIPAENKKSKRIRAKNRRKKK
jgi:hypothetical protein